MTFNEDNMSNLLLAGTQQYNNNIFKINTNKLF